jgi:hypothetical protein
MQSRVVFQVDELSSIREILCQPFIIMDNSRMATQAMVKQAGTSQAGKSDR